MVKELHFGGLRAAVLDNIVNHQAVRTGHRRVARCQAKARKEQTTFLYSTHDAHFIRRIEVDAHLDEVSR